MVRARALVFAAAAARFVEVEKWGGTRTQYIHALTTRGYTLTATLTVISNWVEIREQFTDTDFFLSFAGYDSLLNTNNTMWTSNGQRGHR
jgi:hypothetical protein